MNDKDCKKALDLLRMSIRYIKNPTLERAVEEFLEKMKMITENKRFCRLTEEGLAAWSKHNIEADPMQVFTIEYQSENHVWVKVWWRESCIIEENMFKEVFWNEDRGDYFEEVK